MRYTVTALGSAGDRPVGVVVGTIARYLVAPEPSPETPGAPSPGGGEGEGSVVRYYADRGDSPGRWLGQGARELGLTGEVDFDAFTSVLAGRDPRTGARLISARGSAGRVASLGTGTVARWGPNGEALYTVRDAARTLGWSQADVRAAIVEGERLAASRFVGMLTGSAVPAGTRAAGRIGNGLGGHPDRNRDTGTRTRGSCVQIGSDVHLSGGVGIGGVLEPPQAAPVIIEDEAFIGSRSMVTEGARVGRGAMLGAGVILNPSIPVIDGETGEEVSRGVVPPWCLAINATRPKQLPGGTFGFPCVLIIKRFAEGERHSKATLNAVLREHGIAT